MNKLFKSTLLIATMFLASLGMSQTSFSGPRFSASFNGAVKVNAPTRNPANTSTSTSYVSVKGNVVEEVTMRTVDHDIAVDLTSSQFYRDSFASTVSGSTFTNRNSDGTYQGRPYSYGNYSYTDGGVKTWVFARFIIVDSRTVVMIFLQIPESEVQLNDKEVLPEWQRFENSLSIQ